MIRYMNVPHTTFQWIFLFAALLITLPQGILLFRGAQKRGHFPWLWGLWGLMTFPLPTIFYWLFIVRRDWKKQNKQDH